MGKLENIRRIVRSILAEGKPETNPEKVEFPELDGWKAIKYDPRYRRDKEVVKYAIIDQRNDWIATYELPPAGIIYKNIGGRGSVGHWIKATDERFPSLTQAVRWLYLQVAQGTFHKTLNEEQEETLSKSMEFKRLNFHDIGNYSAEIYKGEMFWSIYDVDSVQKGLLDSNGKLYLRIPEESGFKSSGIELGDWSDESVRQADRWLYMKKQRGKVIEENKKPDPDKPVFGKKGKITRRDDGGWSEIYDNESVVVKLADGVALTAERHIGNYKKFDWGFYKGRPSAQNQIGGIEEKEIRGFPFVFYFDSNRKFTVTDFKADPYTMKGVLDALRYAYLMNSQSSTKKKVVSESVIVKDVAGDLWAKRIPVPGTFDGRTEFWEIYFGNDKELRGLIHPHGLVSYFTSYGDDLYDEVEYDFDNEEESVKQALRLIYLKLIQKRKKPRTVSEGHIEGNLGYREYDRLVFPEIGGYTAVVFERDEMTRQTRIIGSYLTDIYDSETEEVGHIDAQGEVYYRVPGTHVLEREGLNVSHDEEGARKASQLIFLKRSQLELQKKKSIGKAIRYKGRGAGTHANMEVVGFPEIGGYFAVREEKLKSWTILDGTNHDVGYFHDSGLLEWQDTNGYWNQEKFYSTLENAVRLVFLKTTQEKKQGKRKISEATYVNKATKNPKEGDLIEMPEFGMKADYISYETNTVMESVDVVHRELDFSELEIPSVESAYDIIIDGKKAGEITLTKNDEVFNADVFNPRSGIGTDAYIRLGEILGDSGRILKSYKVSDKRTFSVAAESLWKKLERIGFAKMIGDRYHFIPSGKRSNKIAEANTIKQKPTKVAHDFFDKNLNESNDVVVMNDIENGWGAVISYDSIAKSSYWRIYNDISKEVASLSPDGTLSYKIPGKYFDSPWLKSEFKFGFGEDGVRNAARWVYLKIHGDTRK